MADILLGFEPHEAQVRILGSKARYKTIVCGRRFGKTLLSINQLIYSALVYPAAYWYVAPTYKQVKMIAWEILKKSAPAGIIASINETDMLVKFITGGSIRLLGADNEDKLRGVGLAGAILDEYAFMKPHIFPQIIRPMLAEHEGFCWFIGTPAGRNHFYKEFIKSKGQGDIEYRDSDGEKVELDGDYESFQFKTSDNPYIPKDEIRRAQRTMNDAYYRQEFEASFENYTGLIYKEYLDYHNIQMTGLEVSKLSVYVGIDTGQHTAISFLGIDGKGDNYFFDEMYIIDGLVADISTGIKDKLAAYGVEFGKVMFIIDSASQHKREYNANGIYVIDSYKDKLNQIDRVRGLFKNNKIKIERDRCRNMISQLRGYVWDMGLYGKSKQPRPKKENDHFCDVVAYLLGSDYVVNVPVSDKTEGSYEEISKKHDFWSDEFEKWEDENRIEWRGDRPIGDKVGVGPKPRYNVTGY
jgi:hypothetical protein